MKYKSIISAMLLAISANVYAQTCTPVSTGSVDASAITSVKVENAGVATSNMPVTFGQVFVKGDVPNGTSVNAKLPDGSIIPMQNDIKARYEDGSAKHVILSGVIPAIGCAETQTLNLSTSYAAVQPVSYEKVTSYVAQQNPTVLITLNGVQYTANPASVLRTNSFKKWLSGSILNEYLVNVPLIDSNGSPHPHLNVRFALRANSTTDAARFDITVENNWAYEPNPSNLTYDVAIYLNGQKVYEKLAITHYHHARWHKVFNIGLNNKVHVKYDVAYLFKTGAVPNYDRSVVITQANINTWKTQYSSKNKDIMGIGLIFPFMPSTSGRADIGLLPAWTVTYLISQDKDMKEMTLNSGDESGSFSMHYRDKGTDRPLRISDYPYAGWGGNVGDSKNPATGKFERFLDCVNACSTPYTWEYAHAPSLGYIPYLITGDYFYLEEMEFSMMTAAFHMNPQYRGTPPSDGLFVNNQMRQQAWEMRGYLEGGFLIPDDDILKGEATRILSKNFVWYNNQYVNNPSANKLNMIIHSYAFNYDNNRGIASWQDDFFTSTLGHAVEMGFTEANHMLRWKVKSPVARMLDPGFCWIVATPYYLDIRDNGANSGDGLTSPYPIYDTWAKVYEQTQPANVRATACGSAEMATALGMPKAGFMIGNDNTTTGYPAALQAALAYAVNAGAIGAQDAWNKFITRPVTMPYSTGPQFAIVPRQ